MNIKSILARYAILFLVAIPNLFLFYLILTPLTVFPSYLLIKLFFPAQLIGNLIITPYGAIELIEACIAGAAYYLLLVLNLSTPYIPIKKRISAVLFSFSVFLVLNIARIVLFSTLFFLDFKYFGTAHLIAWYAVSTILVVGIWIAEVSFFRIKSIPVYSDLKEIMQSIRKKR